MVDGKDHVRNYLDEERSLRKPIPLERDMRPSMTNVQKKVTEVASIISSMQACKYLPEALSERFSSSPPAQIELAFEGSSA